MTPGAYARSDPAEMVLPTELVAPASTPHEVTEAHSGVEVREIVDHAG
jgi:hypothetical protein